MPSTRIAEFDTWRPGYGLAAVYVYKAGTTVLAAIYADENLTTVVANPITLAERILENVSYGRFNAPIYVAEPYELQINSIDRTGVERPPLTTLDDQDASDALVMVTDGEVSLTLAAILARAVDVRDFGEFKAVGEEGASAATNNATLVNALGVAGARGGGYVHLPAGTYQVSNFTVPQGVVVCGEGRAATTLQSTFAGKVATIGGTKAGFCRVTLDGITLVGLSVGVYAANKDQIVFNDVEVKRFETGVFRQGGAGALWVGLYVVNCGTGYKCYGDAASAAGGSITFNEWRWGAVETCSTIGIELKNVDEQCAHNTFCGIGFDSNTGTAVQITGARMTALRDCWWSNNTKNVVADDATPATADNTVIGIEIAGGSINGGTLELSHTLEAVALRRLDLQNVAVTLTTPSNNIIVEDCREISGVTIAGTATAWTRHKTTDRGSSAGVTAGNAATKTWAISLESGQRVYLEGKVVGRGRNNTDAAFYHISVSAQRPGATLNYDTQTANFTVGNVITGATSGATGRITADSDSGATGALTLQDLVGTFVDNEIITDGATGSATVNGTLVTTTAALVGTVNAIRAAQETDATWDATFVANGNEIELRVTGATGKTIEWTADVDVVST